ncbi:predicted protein [Nematostella vectensis]|uniref:Uncharacterized protein n=1 Tax=Nematostella vectensis TaxID=45351 RepID=A7S3Z3_NEMVE|nr:predicted protein [Nematostella vectensis]|eukprot:XP_001633636.1 predicted protein [Nematostella vectensis]
MPLPGNGPNALALSYMLSGNWPYYMPHQHPDPLLDHKLCSESGKSLIEMDLDYLSEGLEGRSFNPVALLFDQLQRPNTDFGYDEGPCLKWLQHNSKSVNHLVLGTGPAGGSWHNMQGSQLTLSLNNWLELPGWEFQTWLREHRSTTSHIAEYYSDYVNKMGLAKNFWNNAKVLSVKRLHCLTKDFLGPYVLSDDRTSIWEIQGVKGSYPDKVEPFIVHAHNVVIATGNNIPKVLAIPGEDQPFVYHKMTDIDELVNKSELPLSEADPCLVVGAGLSAADAILALQSRGIPVIHSFRRAPKDPKIILNQLPGGAYREYASVSMMMRGDTTLSSSAYRSLPKTKLVEIRDKECILRNPDGTHFKQKVSYVFILIGASPDLSYLRGLSGLGLERDRPIDSKANPIDINPFTYESTNESGLYALGPLVGDNFVRFGMGGGLGIVNHIFRGDETEC